MTTRGGRMGITMGCFGWDEDGGGDMDVFRGVVGGMAEDKLSS